MSNYIIGGIDAQDKHYGPLAASTHVAAVPGAYETAALYHFKQ